MGDKIDRKWVVFIIAVVVLAAGGVYWFLTQPSVPVEPADIQGAEEVLLVEYQNKEGQTWRLSQEPITEFTVASREETYPKFVSGKIEPLDVVPGDIQKFEIVIEDDVAIERVWAEIEQDNGTTTIDLILKESRALTLTDIESRPFLVKENGELVPNNNRTSGAAFKLFKKAQAQSLMLYTYVGEWEVFDTHERTYITKFWAVDEQGRENSMTMAWSDSCVPPIAGGNWTTGVACNISTVSGTDIGNITVSGGDFTLSAGGTLVFNSGKSITISSPIILAGGAITHGYFYYEDRDADNYSNPVYSTFHYSSSETPPYWYSLRMKDNSGADCDSNDDRFQFWLPSSPLKCYVDNDMDRYVVDTLEGCSGLTHLCRAENLTGSYHFYASDLVNENYYLADSSYALSTPGNYDCYDVDTGYLTQANPGFTGSMVSDRGDGSWDWDCDGFQSKFYTTYGECVTCDDYGYGCEEESYGDRGWESSIPACGGTGTYIYSYGSMSYCDCPPYTASNCDPEPGFSQRCY